MGGKKKALITGITGQDGSYLAELLLSKSYDVFGLVRRTSNGDFNPGLKKIIDKISLITGDLLDESSCDSAIRDIMPDEIYNLAAQSFVGSSWATPSYVFGVNALGVVNLLEAIRKNKPDAKFYQASSSEMFGKVRSEDIPQKEETRFHPQSPYGVAKVAAHYAIINYRESYNLFAVSGICFNHESPRRGKEFVTRKITKALARIKLGKQEDLSLGNMSSLRDWGFAGDYIKAMWLMLQQPLAEDYVIATGEQHSVEDFVNASAKALDMELIWSGEDMERTASWNGKIIVRVDKKFFRPADVNTLLGDSSKIRDKLGWKPEVEFEELVKMMVESDLEEEKK